MITSIITAQPDSPIPSVGGPGIKVECEAQPIVIKNVSGDKKFKIVVGLDFKVKGLQVKPQYPPYKWEIGDGDRFVFKSFWPFSPNIDKLSATATITTFASLVNNSDLGSEYGIVRLTDSDNHSTLSKDLIQNANKKVQVFFQKDEPNYWNPAETNCLYYYEQFVDKKLITSLIYLDEVAFKAKCNNALACTDASGTKNCYYRQIISENSGYTKNKGIHTFTEILAHENHHIVLWNNWWPNGYNRQQDYDADLYPDDFEKSTEGIKAHFDWQVNVLYEDYNPAHPRGWSIPKQYEEFKCTQAQLNAVYDSFDDKDWSFDKANKYQATQ